MALLTGGAAAIWWAIPVYSLFIMEQMLGQRVWPHNEVLIASLSNDSVDRVGFFILYLIACRSTVPSVRVDYRGNGSARR